jgi:UPF0755 protein
MSSKKNITEKGKKSFQIQAALIIVSGVVFCFVSLYAYQILFTDNILVDKPSKILYIPKNADFKQVLDSLEKGEYVHDKLSFMFLTKLLDYRDNVKPGRYEIKPNTSNLTFIRMLKNGRQTPLKLTLANIRTKDDLIRKLEQKLNLTRAQLADTLNNKDFLYLNYGFNDTTIMTMFIPNTYEVYWTWSVRDLLNYFQKEYNKFWNAERLSKAQEIGLTPTQINIMASIVDAETHKIEEKPRIAGVYMNRYKSGQRLQADPTLVFATGDFGARRINEYHRYYKSPYNTYRNSGLPPGPINLPSINAIDAVLNYEKHDFFYFCAEPNLSGYHLFSKTFEDHLKIARQYWKTLDKEKINQTKRHKNG